MNPVQHILIFGVRVYRWTLSPVLGFLFGPQGCRFTPTCSAYALDALKSHGALGGSWLSVKRICRCHPWGGCGHDPVPPKGPDERNLQNAPHPFPLPIGWGEGGQRPGEGSDALSRAQGAR